jgi:hypothetical protein
MRRSLRSSLRVALGTLALAVVAAAPQAQAQTHVDDVNALLGTITPANNFYSSADPIVVWPGTGTPFNRTVCTRFISETLRHSYALNDDCLRALTGAGKPNTGHYYRAIVNQSGGSCTLADGTALTHSFTRVTNVGQIAVGDLVAILYLDSSEPDSGHTAWVMATPTFVTTSGGENVYDLLVADSSSSFHGYGDSRYLVPDAAGVPDEGVGSGAMRLYTDAAGTITGYRWSHRSKTTYRSDTRDLVIGHYVRSAS